MYIIRPIEQKEKIVMEYMTAYEAAKKWNISQRRVQILCMENRIKGVFKLGMNWVLPIDAEKPVDARKGVKDAEQK